MYTENLYSMKKVEKYLNNRTYTDYFWRLQLLAKSVFKWNDLPNGIDEKWIENFLFTQGKCVWFHDKEKGFMVAKCNPAGMLNYYDEPTLLRAYGTNYVGETLENREDCVLIRNNDIMLPTLPTVQMYAYRLAEITRVMDVNIKAQKTPYIITGSKNQILSLKQAFNQIDDNKPVLYIDEDFDTNSVAVLKTDAPIVFDKLQIQKNAIWNECMTFLGINNANQDKRERLVADEVAANDCQIEMCAHTMLKSREQACKEINELFGLNISVEMRCFDENIKVNDDPLKEGESI